MNTAHILTRAGSQEVEGYLPPDIGDKVSVMLIRPFYGQVKQFNLNYWLDFVWKDRKMTM